MSRSRQINSIGANPLSVFGSGTAYTLTNSSAVVDMGTTDPILTITAPGTYLITARVRVENVGATFAASRVLTCKLRRGNNTAADLTGSTVLFNTPIITTQTNTLCTLTMHCLYTTSNSDDSIGVFADLSVVPSAGSCTVNEASIIAVRLTV